MITPTALAHGIDALERFYTLRNRYIISQFLNSHPTLSLLLIGLRPKLDAFFPGHDRISLSVELSRDGHDPSQLFVWIKTTDNAETAYANIDRFDSEYWIEQCDTFEGLVHIDVEFS